MGKTFDTTITKTPGPSDSNQPPLRGFRFKEGQPKKRRKVNKDQSRTLEKEGNPASYRSPKRSFRSTANPTLVEKTPSLDRETEESRPAHGLSESTIAVPDGYENSASLVSAFSPGLSIDGAWIGSPDLNQSAISFCADDFILTTEWDPLDGFINDDEVVEEAADEDIRMISRDVDLTCIPPSPTFYEKIDELLDMYDKEFCALPITFDIIDNPFRCRRNTSRGSPFLLHAMLAVSLQHLSHINNVPMEDPMHTRALTHRSTAVVLFQGALAASGTHSDIAFLDTALILCTLDLLHSAIGPWPDHFKNALRLLESAGGPAILNEPRRGAQVAMFLWWDCTFAMISRSTFIFPVQYYEAFLKDDTESMLDMVSIAGVPKLLFRWLVELVQLAEEKEKTATMKWATFNMQPVLELEQQITNWFYVDTSTAQDDNHFEHQQDCANAALAWKYGLLIYIARVFKWDSKSGQRPPGVGALSRLCLDHVRCCRRISTVQKQVLIPVFLAGSETTDLYAKQYARDYCAYWSNNSQYRMFQDAGNFLEEIWEKQDANNNSHEIWWGPLVDAKGSSQRGNQGCEVQYLFG